MRVTTVADVPVRALRVTYVGELGWELYCPTEYGAALWAELDRSPGWVLVFDNADELVVVKSSPVPWVLLVLFAIAVAAVVIQPEEKAAEQFAGDAMPGELPQGDEAAYSEAA